MTNMVPHWSIAEVMYAVLLVYGTLEIVAIALRRLRRWRDASDARRERARAIRVAAWRRVREIDVPRDAVPEPGPSAAHLVPGQPVHLPGGGQALLDVFPLTPTLGRFQDVVCHDAMMVARWRHLVASHAGHLDRIGREGRN